MKVFQLPDDKITPREKDLIQMGLDVGVYLVFDMIAGGMVPDEALCDKMKSFCSDDLEELTGMPGEDYAHLMSKNFEQVRKMAQEKKEPWE